MSALLIFVLVALVLLWALLAFLDTDHSLSTEEAASGPPPSGSVSSCDPQEFAFLGKRVFSDQDWKFVQREQSPSLNKLFIKERRAVITHWLLATASRLRAIRTNHLQHSRHSTNLDIQAELKLMFLFLYLSLLCRLLLLLVRFSHPTVPSALVQHFQSAAGRLLALAPGPLASTAPSRSLSSQ